MNFLFSCFMYIQNIYTRLESSAKAGIQEILSIQLLIMKQETQGGRHTGRSRMFSADYYTTQRRRMQEEK